MSLMDSVKELVSGVDGWLTQREGELLYRLASKCKGKGVIVEIGSWKGKSTIWLAKGSEAGKKIKVYAVDPHTGSLEHKEMLRNSSTFKEFKNNIKIAGVKDLVIPIVKTSEAAAKSFKKKIELLFIDGAHDYDSVKADFKAWQSKLLPGGFIVFHDTIWEGPKRVVEENIYYSGGFKDIGFVDSITYAVKADKKSEFNMIGSFSLFKRSLYLRVYNLAAKLHLPKFLKKTGKGLLALFNK